MASNQVRSQLHVEGPNDKWSIINLLIRHGFEYNKIESLWPPNYPLIVESKGVSNLLKETAKMSSSIETAIKTSSNRIVGFIFDADSPIIDRWKAIQHRLKKASVDDVPDSPPPEGFIRHSSKTNTRVGVWLMPDNQNDGKLEDFLKGLIDQNDPLIAHSGKSTSEAKNLGARFPDKDRDKAIIHSWLAWQEVPGQPYGAAIHARYFLHDTETANRFVHWFRKLYGIGS